MITHQYNRNGTLTLSALVTTPDTPFNFYEYLTFYFFDGTVAQAKKDFKQHLANEGMKLIK